MTQTKLQIQFTVYDSYEEKNVDLMSKHYENDKFLLLNTLEQVTSTILNDMTSSRIETLGLYTIDNKRALFEVEQLITSDTLSDDEKQLIKNQIKGIYSVANTNLTYKIQKITL